MLMDLLALSDTSNHASSTSHIRGTNPEERISKVLTTQYRLLTLALEVFTQRNFVADFIRLNLNFILKTTNSLFEPPFVKVRGNIRTSARWKACY